MTTRNTSSASLLEKDLEIIGNIAFLNNLYVHGKINGNIIAPMDSRAALYIQSDSEVIGEIRAPLVVVSGTICGDIFVSRRISLKSTAKINGNIHYVEIQMDEGAEVNGVLASLNNTSDTQ